MIKKKLLYLSAIESPRGGAEEYILALLRHIDFSRWQVQAGLPCREINQPLCRDLQQAGATVRHAEIASYKHGKPVPPGRILLAALWFLLRARPAVVHINIPYPTELYMPMLAAALLRIPTVTTFHLAPEQLAFPPRKLARYHWIRRRHFSWITISRYNLSNLAKAFALKPADFTLIYNGASRERFSIENSRRMKAGREIRERFSLPAESLLIITLARFDRQKGHCFLADAIPEIAALHPESYFIWAGTGELEQSLKVRLHDLGIVDRVIFTGYAANVPELLAASDIFVLPTLYEGHPFALAEAMMAELPCIVSRVSGIPEVARHDQSCLLVEPKSSPELVRSITRLLDDEPLRNSLGRAARAQSLLMSEELMAQKTIAVYTAALGRQERSQ